MLEESKERSEPTARLVRALLILSPLLFAVCYFLARVQDGSVQAANVIGLAAFGKCLAAAVSINREARKPQVTSGCLP